MEIGGIGTEEGVQRSGEVCFFLLSIGTCGREGVRVALGGLSTNEAKQIVRFYQLDDCGRLDVITVGLLFEGTTGSDGFCEAGDLLGAAMKVGRELTDEASKKKGILGECGLCFFECGRFPENRSIDFQCFPNPRNHKAPHCGASRYGAAPRVESMSLYLKIKANFVGRIFSTSICILRMQAALMLDVVVRFLCRIRANRTSFLSVW